ncbi:MAG: PD-(D/E)XK nuclease family protein [Armatimonadetes bacterium]|nr:PD-(D/E)XK nuclease family protein [Armatimonadota bacterium]
MPRPRKSAESKPERPARPQKPPAQKSPRKPEFSPTRLKTFLACPMMYRLEYVERLGRFYHRARAGYAFGSTLHQTLQNFHESGGSEAVSAEQLVERLEADWQSQGYRDAAHEQAHKEAAVRILATYHAAAAERVDTTRTFLTEKMLKWDLGPFLLTGRIDRVDEHTADGALEIVDYKSGRLDVTEEDVRGTLAMSIYQLLVKRHWPDRRVFATIHALRGGVTASASYGDEELAALEEDVRGLGLLILETDFQAVRPVPLPHVCPDCDFLPLCTRAWKREGRNYLGELGLPG